MCGYLVITPPGLRALALVWLPSYHPPGVHAFPEGTKVPCVLAGVVVACFADSLRATVVVRHEGSRLTLYLLYTYSILTLYLLYCCSGACARSPYLLCL